MTSGYDGHHLPRHTFGNLPQYTQPQRTRTLAEGEGDS